MFVVALSRLLITPSHRDAHGTFDWEADPEEQLAVCDDVGLDRMVP